ncbi:hypothetical transcript [Echinococcus multilocularis]|uniref:Hypothetical transcript n=1 Tax=Echinococcus multilocularis TaxID=6211 RepID=A0A068XZI4_ECHMU|nr:hypothetical transcript [Echinococcus multilocularis]
MQQKQSSSSDRAYPAHSSPTSSMPSFSHCAACVCEQVPQSDAHYMSPTDMSPIIQLPRRYIKQKGSLTNLACRGIRDQHSLHSVSGGPFIQCRCWCRCLRRFAPSAATRALNRLHLPRLLPCDFAAFPSSQFTSRTSSSSFTLFSILPFSSFLKQRFALLPLFLLSASLSLALFTPPSSHPLPSGISSIP